MLAFRYIDGELVRFEAGDRASVMIPAEPEPPPLPPAQHIRLSPRERRRRARANAGRGRRSNVRSVAAVVTYPPPRPSRFSFPDVPYERLPPPHRLDAHRFADGRRGVLLYLPAGEKPTKQHERDLGAALRSA